MPRHCETGNTFIQISSQININIHSSAVTQPVADESIDLRRNRFGVAQAGLVGAPALERIMYGVSGRSKQGSVCFTAL